MDIELAVKKLRMQSKISAGDMHDIADAIESLRAQHKAAQDEILRVTTPRDDEFDVYETFYIDAHEWLRPHIQAGKLPMSVSESMQAVIEFWVAAHEGNASELELHRADYNAIKAAGFESPSELLAAYKAAMEQEPVASRRKDLMGNWVYRNEVISGNDPLYAAPIPAQQSPAVAVPENNRDSESPRNIGNEIHNIATALSYSGSESIADELGAIAVRLWALDQSPRITEQDAD